MISVHYTSSNLSTDFKEMLKNESESMIDTYKWEIKACENIIVVKKDNKEKFISGIKKLKAGHQEKYLASFFERKFDELEKKINGT